MTTNTENPTGTKIAPVDELLKIAKHIAKDSPDRSRKTGSVIINEHHEIISFACNTLPEGVEHDDEYLRRPDKYDWTEHAERNAIYAAAKNGVKTDKCHMIAPWFPCVECGRAIVQAGIKTFSSPPPDLSDPDWGRDFAVVMKMFKKASVTFDVIDHNEPPMTKVPEGAHVDVAKDKNHVSSEDMVASWNARVVIQKSVATVEKEVLVRSVSSAKPPR